MTKILVSLLLSVSFISFSLAQGLLFDDLPTFPDSESGTEDATKNPATTTENSSTASSAATTTVVVDDSNTGLPTLTGGIIALTLSLLFLIGTKIIHTQRRSHV